MFGHLPNPAPLHVLMPGHFSKHVVKVCVFRVQIPEQPRIFIVVPIFLDQVGSLPQPAGPGGLC